MQSIVSSDNMNNDERNKYIKFERNEKIFNLFKDVRINILFYENMNNN